MTIRILGAAALLTTLAACGVTAAPEAAETVEIPATGVEIALTDQLDGNINLYCLDIAGGNENVDPANGLQAQAEVAAVSSRLIVNKAAMKMKHEALRALTAALAAALRERKP